MRRLVAGGGARLNDVKIEDPNLVVGSDVIDAKRVKPNISANAERYPIGLLLSRGWALRPFLTVGRLPFVRQDFDSSTGELKVSSGKKKHGIVELVA